MTSPARLDPGRLATVLVIGLPLLALLTTLWPVLHFAWMERSAYSHGYLVLGIALWLAWRELRRAPLTESAPSALGAICLLIVLAVAITGRAADIALLMQLAIPAIVIAALWAAFGWRAAQRFLLPAAYTMFAMPFWDAMTGRLQSLTVSVVGSLTRISSIPAFIEGNFIRIPSGTFEVAGGCSGLNFMMVGCALGALYGVLNFRSWWFRAGTLAVSIVLALVANWIRVFTVIVAGHLTDMQHYLVTVDHYYFGWAVFVVVFALMFIGGRYVVEPDARSAPRPASSARAASGGAPSRVPRVGDWRVVSSAALIAVAAWLSFQAGARPERPVGAEAPALPEAIGGWQLNGDWASAERPVFVNFDWQTGAQYGRNGSRVSVFVAHYGVQDQGREIIFYANRPIGGEGRGISGGTVDVARPGSDSITFAEIEVETGDGRRRLVWYLYEVAGMRTTEATVAKLYQVIGGLRGRWDAQVLVLSTACVAGCEDARMALSLFAGEATQSMLTLMRKTDENRS